MSFPDNPLLKAASKGDIAAVRTLIEQGADLNIQDENGWTPLHATMLSMHTGSGCDYPERVACAKALLEAGADPTLRLFDKLDVMHNAVVHRVSELVRLLKDRGMEILPSCSLLDLIDSWPRSMFRDAIGECREILQMILEEQPDLDQRTDDEHQRTALHIACGRGNHAAIEDLLAAGADPNDEDANGDTPLSYLANFAWRSQTDCLFSIYMLIRCGADLDRCGNGPDSDTALNWLIKYGGNRVFVVTLLLESGADPNKPNAQGETPLIHAAASDRLDLVQTLLIFGAEPELRDVQGLMALDHARKGENLQLIDVLEKNSGPSPAVTPVEKVFSLRYVAG